MYFQDRSTMYAIHPEKVVFHDKHVQKSNMDLHNRSTIYTNHLVKLNHLLFDYFSYAINVICTCRIILQFMTFSDFISVCSRQSNLVNIVSETFFLENFDFSDISPRLVHTCTHAQA